MEEIDNVANMSLLDSFRHHGTLLGRLNGMKDAEDRLQGLISYGLWLQDEELIRAALLQREWLYYL